MKKAILLLCMVGLFSTATMAQPLAKSMFFDNWYIGATSGTYIPSSTFKISGNTEWMLGWRVGKWFTPDVGLSVEAQHFFGKKGHFSVSHTAINVWNASVLGMVNFHNWFSGYLGTPRPFEVIGVLGIGGAGLCGAGWKYVLPGYDDPHPNSLTASLGLDFTLNFGSKKQWQVYMEPRMMYELANENENVQFNNSRALFSLNVGVNYKFMTTNTTHNFKFIEIVDPERVNMLTDSLGILSNSAYNKDLQLANKNAEIDSLQQAIQDINRLQLIQKRKVTVNVLQPVVIFRQNKYIIDPLQFAPIEVIAKYMRKHPDSKIEVRGYASPEGVEHANQKLSENRANAVRNALIKKYDIAPERLTATGCGTTDDLFDEFEFNRVVLFIDQTKYEEEEYLEINR